MSNGDKGALFFLFTIAAIICLGIGVAKLVSVGCGFIIAAICCIIAIPCGIEFDKKYLQ